MTFIDKVAELMLGGQTGGNDNGPNLLVLKQLRLTIKTRGNTVNDRDS